MATLVCEQIMRLLCNNHGCLEFRQLDRMLKQTCTVDQTLLMRVLSDTTHFKFVGEQQRDLVLRSLSPTALIIGRTELRICSNPTKCEQCQQLHLCKYLVCGNCKFGTECKKSHDLKSPHNSAVLKNYHLQCLNETQLFQLLLLNDPSLVPEICSHYNKGDGHHGTCKFKSSCTSLHVCQHFLQDDCIFGAKCKRSHTFDEAAQKMLNGRGFSAENICNLPQIYKNKQLLAAQNDTAIQGMLRAEKVQQHSSSSVSEADRNEICLYFMRNGCSFKEKCVRIHHDLPYKWEILDKGGMTWRDMPNQEDIEKAYCNPANDKSSGTLPVDFTSMTCGGTSVRRLSTASSVTKPPNYILTTEWHWYWKNDQGKWIEYGQGEDVNLLSAVTSKTLEKEYLAEVETEVQYVIGGQKYVLNLKGMYQKNLKYTTKREVRRRPQFVSAQDVEGKKKKSDGSESSSSSTVIPTHWDKGALHSYSFKFVPLSSSTDEYKTVLTLFQQTMPTSTIHNIKRVQNPSLWKVYQWQKDQMKERNGGKDVNERRLFHGTDQSITEAICDQNFDWRMCGSHGTVYGRGSYFARDAKYSNKYAKSKGGSKMMFVALVLVGEFTKGSSSFRRPPQKKDKSGFYDSCVDNEANPSIFVIFEKQQIYPEYVIEYS